MGWLAMASCAPLIGSAFRPPLWAVLTLWALAGAGGAYQLVASAAFVQTVPPEGRGRAFGLAQSGLLAVQGLGIVAGGALASVIGATAAAGAVAPAGRPRGRGAVGADAVSGTALAALSAAC